MARGSSGMVSVGAWGEFMGVGGYGALIPRCNNGKAQSAQASNKARANTHNALHGCASVNASNATLECVGNAMSQAAIHRRRSIDATTRIPQSREYERIRENARDTTRKHPIIASNPNRQCVRMYEAHDSIYSCKASNAPDHEVRRQQKGRCFR